MSAVRDYVFNIFAATHVIGGRSSRRDLKMHLAMLTGTHLLWDSCHYVVNIKAVIATSLSVEHDLMFSGTKPICMHTFVLSVSHYQAVCKNVEIQIGHNCS